MVEDVQVRAKQKSRFAGILQSPDGLEPSTLLTMEGYSVAYELAAATPKPAEQPK
jgi:hypothetical protein